MEGAAGALPVTYEMNRAAMLAVVGWRGGFLALHWQFWLYGAGAIDDHYSLLGSSNSTSVNGVASISNASSSAKD